MATYERFEDLPVWQAAADLYGFAESLLSQPELDASPGWRDHFDRATLAVSSHLARGFERGTPAERFVAVREARTAAAEVRSLLRVLERRRISRDAQVPVARLKALADSCATQLRAYADSLQEAPAPASAMAFTPAPAVLTPAPITPAIAARPPELRPPQVPSPKPSPDFGKRTVQVARKILGILPHHSAK